MTITTSQPILTGAVATTYPELTQQVADFLARNDLTAFIPTFIGLAEDWLTYGFNDMLPLRVREMEAIETLTPVDGVCDLPTDFLQNIRAVETGATRRVLNYIDADISVLRYPTSTAGIPADFTIIGESLYMFPPSDNDIDLTYYQRIPQLSMAESNWLLTKAPSIYLRATLAVAADFIKDMPEFDRQFSLTKMMVDGLNRSNMIGKYARASLSIRGPAP